MVHPEPHGHQRNRRARAEDQMPLATRLIAIFGGIKQVRRRAGKRPVMFPRRRGANCINPAVIIHCGHRPGIVPARTLDPAVLYGQITSGKRKRSPAPIDR